MQSSSSHIDQLTNERDIQRLQTEKKEAELREAHAQRELLEQMAKIEEARKRWELVKSQSGNAVPPSANKNGTSHDLQSTPALRKKRALPVDSAHAGQARLAVAATTNDNKSHAPKTSEQDSIDLGNDDSSFASDADKSYKEAAATRRRGAKRQRQQCGRSAKPTATKKRAAPPKKAKPGTKKATKVKKTRTESNKTRGNISDTFYTEEELMSTYTPNIVDHSLVVTKFLLEFNKNGEANSACQCWSSFEDFVFPGLAREYLSKLIEEGSHPDQNEVLALWRDEFIDRETRMNRENTISNLSSDSSTSSTEEGGKMKFINQVQHSALTHFTCFNSSVDLSEVDFCCFLCKCSLDNSTLKLVQNCPEARKFHRGCCHGYTNPEDLNQFVSKVGRAQRKYLSLSETAIESNHKSGQDDEPEMPQKENVDFLGAKPSAVIIDSIHGTSEQIVSANRESVVLSINAGIGSVLVAFEQLKLKAKRIIHVEEDRVARHVIRSNHDIKYGETETDDGLDHIIGLYDGLADLKIDIEDFVKRFGPIGKLPC